MKNHEKNFPNTVYIFLRTRHRVHQLIFWDSRDIIQIVKKNWDEKYFFIVEKKKFKIFKISKISKISIFLKTQHFGILKNFRILRFLKISKVFRFLKISKFFEISKISKIFEKLLIEIFFNQTIFVFFLMTYSDPKFPQDSKNHT